MKRIYITCILCLLLISSLFGCAVEVPENNGVNSPVSDMKTYESKEGWLIKYPETWDKLGDDYIQETATGKTLVFDTKKMNEMELMDWIDSEIKRKLSATEANNTLHMPLTVYKRKELPIYEYAIKSKMESKETILFTTIIFDGEKKYEFRTAMPEMKEEEYREIIDSFEIK